jgi:hypothetical protein
MKRNWEWRNNMKISECSMIIYSEKEIKDKVSVDIVYTFMILA